MAIMRFVVGGWLASRVISNLIVYAKDQKIQLDLKDELVARLENALPNIQEVVKTVDQGLIREENPALEKWLWQLRDAVDQADDVMDEMKYNYEKEKVESEKNKFNKRLKVEAEENMVNKRLKVEAITNHFRTIFSGAVDEDPFLKRLKKAVKAIEEVAADVGLFSMLVQNLVAHQKGKVKSTICYRETTSFLTLQNHVFGRQDEKKDIIKKLLNLDCKTNRENLTILPIIGVGGVGKTTLAQLVYNDPILENHFELRLWVCVSNNFDVVLLTKKLYESTFGQRPPQFDSFDLIQKKLKEKFESRRFLVVFDDVWNDNNKEDWEKLIEPLKIGKNGSMMLLTTRMKSVVTLTGLNLMDSIVLEGLNECDMWDLFKECAFGGEDPNYHKELVTIGKDIVKKLEGIPLAARTVGGILCSNLEEDYWIDILESELWSLKQGQDDIMPALRLTYQYLPSYLKPCFLFCSIFPQDYLFSKNDLIYMWIALGMVPRSVNGTMSSEDVGSKYFDEMLSKSIFICPNLVFPNENQFIMHDLIHELSILVSQGECLRTSTNKLVYVPNTIRHLYARIDGPNELRISSLKNLRTLVIDIDEFHHPEQDSIVTELLEGMESLRLLILFANNLSEFPESASKLLHLRYLRLNSYRIHAFPKSVSKLYFLETMVYNDFWTSKLEHADALGMLVNLRHLIIPGWLLDRIAGIGRLTSLQELYFTVRKDSGFKISELSDMRELRVLRISSIENVGSREEVIQANLKEKVNLNELSLIWARRNRNKEANEGVLDHLQPHSGLKELSIRSYEGTGRPPIWFRTQTLSNLVRLKIQVCNFVHLPCLDELPLLKYINFRDMNAIENIIHECNTSSAVDAFPSLEQIYIRRMRAIKEWCLAKQPNKWMHCLRKLEIIDCPELQVLPPVPVGIKELSFKDLGINALPTLWNDQSSESGSLSDLVVMSISNCKNLVSLTEGLLQSPERLEALEELYITDCKKLVNFPLGGFNKCISLKKLDISDCPQIDGQLVSECFLPSALQKLSISSCGQLETTLPKAFKGVHSLIELELRVCFQLTTLPPKEVFNRWKTLKKLILEDCRVLTSLESLLGLSCIEHLEVRGCPQLSQAIPFPLPLKKDETERKEEGRSISAQPQPLFSVDKLVIDNPFLLSVEPLRSLSAVKVLIIEDCSELQSLPELPPLLQELHIRRCSPELQTRCEKSGQDWPKLSQIPMVLLGGVLLSRSELEEEDNVGYMLD
ncbi:disease resistance protein RGA2-like [Carex rostrata]